MSDWKEKGKLHQEIELFMQKNQYKKALKIALRLLKLDPKDLDTLYNTGIIYAHLGNLPKATEMNQKILDLNPEDADALINMAQLSELRGDNQQAREFYSKALESDLSRIFLNRELWNLALKRFAEEKEMLQRIADQCVFSGDIEKLMDLETKTHILGPENFKVATKLSSILKRFQMIFSSPPVLDPFPEKFFRIDEVWEQFLTQINLDVGATIFNPGVNIPYNALKMDELEKINLMEPKDIALNIIMSLDTLKKEGKYKTSDQLWAEREEFKDRYEVRRVN